MIRSIKGRLLAIIAGLGCTTGALTILLGSHLMKPLEWTSYQVLTILTVFITTAIGHLMAQAGRKHPLACGGFLLLFLTGTVLVVCNSVGRQAETTETSAMSVEATNKLIAEKSADLERAKARRDYADQQAALEIAGRPDKRGRPTTTPGCGKNCQDWQQNSKDVLVVIKQLEHDISALGPKKPVNVKAARIADMLALFGVNRAKAMALFNMVEPLLWCLFFEIGSIVSLGFAFRSRGVSVSTVSEPANDVEIDPPKPRGGKRRPSQKNVIRFPGKHPVIEALEANGGSVSSNQTLASLMSVSEGESSKRVQEIEHLIERRKVGKQLTISLRKSA